jgi:hypothetical protein
MGIVGMAGRPSHNNRHSDGRPAILQYRTDIPVKSVGWPASHPYNIERTSL